MHKLYVLIKTSFRLCFYNIHETPDSKKLRGLYKIPCFLGSKRVLLRTKVLLKNRTQTSVELISKATHPHNILRISLLQSSIHTCVFEQCNIYTLKILHLYQIFAEHPVQRVLGHKGPLSYCILLRVVQNSRLRIGFELKFRMCVPYP